MNTTREEALAQLLAHYEEPYVCAQRGDVGGPLAATAFMHLVSDKKLLGLAAVGETESDDFVYLFSVDELTEELFDRCYTHALDDGLGRVDPNPNHSFSMISLFFLCDAITPEAAAKVKKTKFRKDYAKPEAGWAELRLAAVETGGAARLSNPMGKTLLGIYKNSVQ